MVAAPRTSLIAATPKARSRARESRGAGITRIGRAEASKGQPPSGSDPPGSVLPATAAVPAATAAVAGRALLLARARRCVLGALDQLLGLDERAVLVLGDEL